MFIQCVAGHLGRPSIRDTLSSSQWYSAIGFEALALENERFKEDITDIFCS